MTAGVMKLYLAYLEVSVKVMVPPCTGTTRCIYNLSKKKVKVIINGRKVKQAEP